jgi:hypothetical protein
LQISQNYLNFNLSLQSIRQKKDEVNPKIFI